MVSVRPTVRESEGTSSGTGLDHDGRRTVERPKGGGFRDKDKAVWSEYLVATVLVDLVYYS